MNNNFIIRSYWKSELACIYMPDCSPRAAIATFNMWLQRSPNLWNKLEETGMTLLTRRLTPQQVKIITEYLGNPYTTSDPSSL